MKALQCYTQEYERNGESWEKYVLSQATLGGLEAGCDLAESFEVVRYAYQS